MNEVLPIRLRPVTPADSADLLAWRNDPVTRVNSRNTSAVDPAGHEAWLARALADPDRRLWIAEGAGGKLGTVSANRDGDVELSITVAPGMRGRGAGTAMIRAALAEVRALWPQAAIRAAVRLDNLPSRRLFEHCGFAPIGETDGFVAYRFTG